MNKADPDNSVKVERSLGCSDNKTAKLNFLREMTKTNNRIELKRADLGSVGQNLTGDLSVGPQSTEELGVFQDHLPQNMRTVCTAVWLGRHDKRPARRHSKGQTKLLPTERTEPRSESKAGPLRRNTELSLQLTVLGKPKARSWNW